MKAEFGLFDITKTCLYSFDPLEPHFYIEKLGFTRVYIIFLIFAQNIDCGYSLEPPRWGGSNEYHNLCFEQKYEKNIRFLAKNFLFLEMKISIYLNRRVFVMNGSVFYIWCCKYVNICSEVLYPINKIIDYIILHVYPFHTSVSNVEHSIFEFVAKGASFKNAKPTGKQCRSWRDGSLIRIYTVCISIWFGLPGWKGHANIVYWISVHG